MTELTKTIKKAMSGDFDTQFELIYAFAELGYSITIKKFEEEKKMLNIDKYREDIMSKGADAARLDCHIAALRGVGNCGGKLCKMCMRESLKWLFSEYEPPLLENGDGLKPGDWIMVRDVDSQSFVRRQFLYFFDGKFICSAPNHAPLEGFGEPWVQARLLEDGE